MTTPRRWVSWGERNPQSRGTSSIFSDMPDGGWGPVLVWGALHDDEVSSIACLTPSQLAEAYGRRLHQTLD